MDSADLRWKEKRSPESLVFHFQAAENKSYGKFRLRIELLYGRQIIPSRKIAIALIIVLSAFGLGLNAWYWFQLPDQVATHFGVHGNPNDWMSKTNATILLCSLQVGLPLFFVFLGWAIAKMPASVINIPNNEYWMQPERRSDSIARIANMLAWIAVLISAETIAIVHLTFLANRSGTPLNTNLFLIILGIFLGSVFLVVVRSMWHFRLPRSNVLQSH